MAEALVDALLSSLGRGPVVVDPDVMVGYSSDRAQLLEPGRPAAVVRARHVADVVATLRIASERGVPVVTRGAGTGLSGGANAVDGCIVLSVAGMRRILDIDVASRHARVEPGVLNAELADAAAAQGLCYVPDPASRSISTIGGNVATNAGGSCCLKYGVTGDHVAALTAVLANGRILRTGSLTRKNVAGYDLTRLLVGSEGTLAVIVEATVRLRPVSRPPVTVVAFFLTAHDAVRAVTAMSASADPSMLELMDRTTIHAVERMTHMGLDTTAGALLVAQSDAGRDDAKAVAAACSRARATFVASTEDPVEAEVFLHARRSALPALERLGSVLLDDIAVPVPVLPAVVDAIEGVAARHHVVVGTFGHAGDGNLHPTVVFDPADAASRRRARLAFEDIVEVAVRAGGSITGEHGVGALKVGHLDSMYGPVERQVMRRVKEAFDPLGILNPGRAI